MEPPEKVEVPEEIADLIHRYKRKETLTEEQESALFDFLVDQDIKNLLMAPPYGFNKRDYGRITRAMERRGRGAAAKVPRAEAELPRIEAKDYRDFIRGLWEDAKNIGTTTVMRWVRTAGEFGYFDETVNKVNMVKFVEDSCDFFIKYHNKIAELELDALANKGLAAMLAEATEKLTQTIMLLRAQLESLEARHPQLRYELIPMHVLTNLERYLPKEEAT